MQKVAVHVSWVQASEVDKGELLCCGKPCHKALPKCPHVCQAVCHQGPCPAASAEGCQEEVTVRCSCRRRKAKMSCHQVSAFCCLSLALCCLFLAFYCLSLPSVACPIAFGASAPKYLVLVFGPAKLLKSTVLQRLQKASRVRSLSENAYSCLCHHLPCWHGKRHIAL